MFMCLFLFLLQRFLEGSLKEMLLRRRLARVSVWTGFLRRVLRRGGVIEGAQKAEKCPFAEYGTTRRRGGLLEKGSFRKVQFLRVARLQNENALRPRRPATETRNPQIQKMARKIG